MLNLLIHGTTFHLYAVDIVSKWPNVINVLLVIMFVWYLLLLILRMSVQLASSSGLVLIILCLVPVVQSNTDLLELWDFLT